MWKKYLKELNLPESYISLTLGFLIIIVGGLLVYNQLVKKNNKSKLTLEETPIEEKQLEESETILPTVHIVSRNENLWTIAEKYYKSGYNWVSIASKNNLKNPDKIFVGQTLTIPKAKVIKPKSEKILTQAMNTPKTYTVVRGDSLWKIAVAQYGDGYAWTKIARANNLVNPDLIHAGNVLTLPN